jgi:Arc/MetJ family transcription regulator
MVFLFYGGEGMLVRTNIVLDDDIVREAQGLTSLKTKRDVVDLALRALVKNLKRKKLLKLRRKGLWEGNLEGMRRKRFDTY